MNGFKNVFASKTVIASIVGAIFAILAAIGVLEIDAETQAAVVAVLFGATGVFRFTATEKLAVGSTSV